MENKKRRMSSFSPPHSIHMILSLNPIHLITNITNRIQGQKKKRERERADYLLSRHAFIYIFFLSFPPPMSSCVFDTFLISFGLLCSCWIMSYSIIPSSPISTCTLCKMKEPYLSSMTWHTNHSQ